MRALDGSDPNDPRGFTQQAHVHCYWCSTGPAADLVHFSWKFLVWHRAYLYFHERILGKLISNQNFRLPFWGWDSPLYHKLPTAYATDGGNPLFNGTRVLGPTDALPDEDVGPTVIDDALNLGSFDLFGGAASAAGSPEFTPHGAVHVDVGGDMGAFETAAQDPIFYQHHATVDKLWSDWNKASATHTDPTSTAFRNLTFYFFDENKVWRSITAAQVLNHEASLRYVYEPYRFWDIFRCLIWRPFPSGWRTTQRIRIPPNHAILGPALRGEPPVRFDFRGLVLPNDRTATYRIYATRAEALRDPGPDGPGYLGAVSVVLNSRENRHPTRPTGNLSVQLRPEIRGRLAQGEPFQPFLVDRADKGPEKQVIPLRAADVLVSAGLPDRGGEGINK